MVFLFSFLLIMFISSTGSNHSFDVFSPTLNCQNVAEPTGVCLCTCQCLTPAGIATISPKAFRLHGFFAFFDTSLHRLHIKEVDRHRLLRGERATVITATRSKVTFATNTVSFGFVSGFK